MGRWVTIKGAKVFIEDGEDVSDAFARQKKKDVDFATITKMSKNSISFSKIVTVMPHGYMPTTGRKKDLETMLNKHNINDVIVHMYRDKAGANDLKRMQDLGFTIEAQYKGESKGSSIPPTDYYYMKRRSK